MKTLINHLLLALILSAFSLPNIALATDQISASPQDPGPAPENPCGSGNARNPWGYNSCMNNYLSNLSQWEQRKAAYNAAQLQQNPGQSASEGYLRAIKELQEQARYQKKQADKKKLMGTITKTLGILVSIAGGIMIAYGTAMITGSLGTASALGWWWIAAGAALILANFLLIQPQTQKLASKEAEHRALAAEAEMKAQQSCTALRQMTSKDVGTGWNCAEDVMVGADGTYVPPAQPKLLDMIDPKTNECKADSPAFCSTVVSKLKDNCKEGLASCLANLEKQKNNFKVDDKGKITVTAKGKTYSFTADDFKDPQSMVKAGFSPAEAQSFFSASNESSRKELESFKKNLNSDIQKSLGGDYSFTPSSSYSSSGSKGKNAGSGQRYSDEGTVVKSKDVAAATPEPEQQTSKIVEGESIGTSGSDLFKLMKNRYQLKSNQSTFIEP